MEKVEFKEKLIKAFNDKLSIDLTDTQVNQFFNFMNLLIEKNRVMNLTAIDEPNEIIIKHFLDSCMLLKFVKDFDGKDLIDVGTGAGFPGMPLAIILNKANFVLTDTLGKRIFFLEEVIKELKLNNVKLIKARAEDLAHEKLYRERFDYVLSRAVANISILSEYSLPFVKLGGIMIAYKMADCQKELFKAKNAIITLGGMFYVEHNYSIITSDPDRTILMIKKVKETPKNYPRKAGTPSKNPL